MSAGTGMGIRNNIINLLPEARKITEVPDLAKTNAAAEQNQIKTIASQVENNQVKKAFGGKHGPIHHVCGGEINSRSIK